MKRKTYNNVLKAGNLIQKKGYDEKEALELAVRLFDNLPKGKDVEFIIDKVATKEKWLDDQRKYGYLFQGGMKSYPSGY
ncbi:hypothetical protein SAMN05443270_3064 [Lacrimispora sphenoides]|uniref:hypothetical protein n=1 Tax=Lacrimispora sphenoides TaxID=29370 RepID=UPI0008B1054B|nr:hypothetical protein [Lacrimispora sphenoides]SEU09129.1 hypothetical protein SAMN05443270_3064 [Lacrimispora sphenoides]